MRKLSNLGNANAKLGKLKQMNSEKTLKLEKLDRSVQVSVKNGRGSYSATLVKFKIKNNTFLVETPFLIIKT